MKKILAAATLAALVASPAFAATSVKRHDGSTSQQLIEGYTAQQWQAGSADYDPNANVMR